MPDRSIIVGKVAHWCLQSEDTDVRAFGTALRDGGSLEALGLTTGWQARRAKAEHDVLIGAYAAAHIPAETFNGRATAIHLRLWDYSQRAWRREKTLRVCPHAARSDRAYLWAIMRALAVADPARSDTPLGADRLARILSAVRETSGER